MSSNIEKTLIAVVGPTAIGKTALAIKLAQYFNTEIISADSRQFFKEMNIGTAVPSEDELQAVKHHFVQHISIEEPYSVGHFENDALKTLENIFKKSNVAIVVGGSGLYVDALINGLDKFPKVDAETKNHVREKLTQNGLKSLQNELKSLDPEYYTIVDLNNTQRVSRAVEVCISSGQPYSSFLSASKIKRSFRSIKIGLKADRSVIYERINTRVDNMFEQGLEEEAKRLFPQKEYNALNTVGYKELFAYFEDKMTKTETIEEIKKNTRRFAKRQLTWYRKDLGIFWFDYDYNLGTITKRLENLIFEPE